MRASLRLAVHWLRVHWRAWLVLALLVGVAGGATLAAAAGARRTESAYPRFLAWSRASDVLVAPAGPGTGGFDDALARLPHAVAVAPLVGLNLEPVNRAGQLAGDAVVVAPLDRRYGSLVDRARVLAGRLPAAGHPAEVAIDQHGAAELGVYVGSYLRLAALPNNPGPSVNGVQKHVRTLEVKVVGILVTKASIDPVTDLDKEPHIIAGTGLWHELGPQYEAFDGAEIRLQAGTTAAAFGKEAQALARHFPNTHGQIYLADEGTQASTVERSIKPASVALWLFALVLAITALLVVGQAASRVLALASADNQPLSALGATRGQLTAAALLGVAVAGVFGAALAVVLAVAVSPLMPIGVARLAEPDPGVSVDAVVLAIGAFAIVLLLLARAVWPAGKLASVRAATAAAVPGRRSRLADGLGGLGLPVTASTGVRLALEPGRGRTAVPVRSVLAGTMLSVLAVTGAFTFGANLTHLVHAPRLYGRAWDAAIDLQFGSVTKARVARLFAADPQIARWSFGDHGVISIGHQVVPDIGLAAGRGRVLSPTLLEGRQPRSADEIVLGTSTLQQAGKRVGQWVKASSGGRLQRFHIVGRAVFPDFGQGSFTPTDLGQGAETTVGTLAAQVRAADVGRGFEFVLVRFDRGADWQAATARFRRLLHPVCVTVQQSTCVVTGQQPNGITDYARIDAVPEVLGGLLAVLGLAVLSQLIVVSGRRRRRDFAVLRALGLLRHQVSSITAWQVSTLAVLALAAGLPLGIAAGRRGWALFGAMLGVPANAITPMSLVLLTIPAVVLLANAAAFWPGRRAARARAADVLRVE
jgi:hypothetical protein